MNPDEVSCIEYDSLIAAEQLGEAILLIIPLKKGEFELELRHVPDSFYDYTVTTSDGQQTPANKEIRHYRGIIKDDPNSLVAISFWKNEVMGLIANEAGNFNLSFDKKLGVHLFFNYRNLKQKMDFQCGTKSESLTHYDPNVLFQSSRSNPNIIGGCIRLYFETEYDIYQNKGSVGSVESYITGIFNEVAILFENENIGVLLSDIHVWNVPDPYTATTAANLLTQFQNERTSFVGDLGQLVTFRVLSGPGGIAAKVGGLCDAQVKNKLCVSYIENYYYPFPYFSWSVYIVAHEFGHLLGSKHTHDCVWNGNNTAIDGCATPDGCSTPIPAFPPGGGTIMSYCWDKGDGINFNLGFGPQPGNVIRNFVATAHCINPVITGPSPLCSSDTYTITNLPTGATVTGWSVSHPYDVSLSGSGNSRTATRIGDFCGEVTLTVTLSTSCGNIEVQRKIWVGEPLIYDVGYPSSSAAPNQPIPLSITPYPNSHPNGVFKAVITRIIGPGGPYSHTVQGTVIEISLPSPGLYNVYVYAQNACGWPDESFFYPLVFTCVDDDYLLFSTSTDPSGAVLNVSFTDESGLDTTFDRSLLPAYRAVLYNGNGKQVGEAESRDGRIGLDTRTLPQGDYTLHIHYSNDRVQKQEVKIGKS